MNSFDPQERRQGARRSTRSLRSHGSNRSSWSVEEERREQERIARRQEREAREQEREAREQEREARRVARAHRESARSIGADTLAMPHAQARGYAGRNAEKPHGRGETVRAAERARKGTYEVSHYAAQNSGSMKARPAVYTQEPSKPSLLERLGLKKSRGSSAAHSGKSSAGFSNGSSLTSGTGVNSGYEARPAIYTQKASRKDFLFGRRSTSSVLLSKLQSHLPSLDGLPHIPIPVLVLAFVTIALSVIYGPARTYYAAWREAGILETEYQVVTDQNAELNEELDRLQSLEGIEEEARKRGYAYPDEEALVVEDLEEETLADPSLAAKAVTEHEKNLPWYVQLLDKLLGYKHR